MDLGTRTSLAMLIRRFLAGEITNMRYDDTALTLLSYYPDDGAFDVYNFFWHSYDDIVTHRAGRLTPEARRAVARCLLFLYSNSPALPAVPHRSRGLFGGRSAARPDAPDTLTSESHWPFATADDFKAARARPLFLAGARRAG